MDTNGGRCSNALFGHKRMDRERRGGRVRPGFLAAARETNIRLGRGCRRAERALIRKAHRD
jgi:hypothetical protein